MRLYDRDEPPGDLALELSFLHDGFRCQTRTRVHMNAEIPALVNIAGLAAASGLAWMALGTTVSLAVAILIALALAARAYLTDGVHRSGEIECAAAVLTLTSDGQTVSIPAAAIEEVRAWSGLLMVQHGGEIAQHPMTGRLADDHAEWLAEAIVRWLPEEESKEEAAESAAKKSAMRALLQRREHES